MSSRYDDMIYMQNPTPTCKPRMSLYERAAQFSPFAALTGYEYAEIGRASCRERV